MSAVNRHSAPCPASVLPPRAPARPRVTRCLWSWKRVRHSRMQPVRTAASGRRPARAITAAVRCVTRAAAWQPACDGVCAHEPHGSQDSVRGGPVRPAHHSCPAPYRVGSSNLQCHLSSNCSTPCLPRAADSHIALRDPAVLSMACLVKVDNVSLGPRLGRGLHRSAHINHQSALLFTFHKGVFPCAPATSFRSSPSRA